MSEPTAPEAEAPVVEQVDPAAAPEPTFDAKYVERLRTEAGKYRTERNDATVKLNAVLGALGIGDRQEDPAAAASWTRKAAEQGHRQAQSKLADFYSEGKGVRKDLVVAYAIYEISAKSGDSAALKSQQALAEKLPPEQINEAKTLAASWKKGSPLPKQSKTGTTPPLNKQ